MKKFLLILAASISLFSCRKLPEQKDYLGVYRIIKVEENGEIIKTEVLNHIELTESLYIYRIDRNGDNQFSEDEVSLSTYLFSVGDNGTAQIHITGNDLPVSLMEHGYYDLKFERFDDEGNAIILFTRKLR